MTKQPDIDIQEGIKREKKLSRWIIILLLFASTVMVVQGYYNLSNLRKVDASIDTVYQTAHRLDALARDITKPVADIRILSKQLVLSPNKLIAKETKATLTQTIDKVKVKLSELNEIIRDNDQFQNYQSELKQILQAWQDYLGAVDTTLKYQESGVRVAAFLSVSKQEKAPYERLQQSISNFSKILLEQSREVYDQALDKSNKAFISLLVTVVIEILILKFILYFVWRMFRSFIQAADIHEQALKKERQQLQHTLNASPIGVGVTVDSKLVYINKKLDNMLNVKVGDQISKTYVEPEKRNELMQLLEKQKVVPQFDVKMYKPNGEVMDTLSTFYKIDYNSKPGILAWISDITELKQADRKNLEAKKLAEEATRAKSDFLANMSHEIRTPMNAILGLSELALETELTAKQYNYINKVHRSAESLLGIINDILDFSKIEAGKLTMESVDFRLEDVMENLASLLGFRAEEKNLELLFDIPNDLPPALVGDPLRLGQVLINLGNNAIKFTEQGEVIIRVFIEEVDHKKALLMFEVSDTGIGIPQEKLATLFESFSQADTSTSRQFGGTGLGLAISKKLTQLMGGSIFCESEEGKGSTFRFSAPFTLSETIIKRPSIDDVGVMKVLVVDDNSSSREIFISMLEQFGLKAEQANSGREALTLIQQADQSNTPYDLVLMDWKMPALDGIETSRQIQQNTPLRKPPTIIMVTAYGRESSIEAASEVEINSFLTKPVTPSSLLDAILLAKGKQAVKTNRGAGKEEEVEQAINALRGAKLLLAEDNEINMELAVDILQRHDISVVTAINGEEALKCLQQESFDGVLMDCQMPILDGYKATQAIRAQVRYKSLPILAMTANAMVGDKEKVLAVGMNDHIAKPIVRRDLFLTMARWITPKQPITKPRIESINELNNDTLGCLPEVEGIDVMQGMQTFVGNISLYKKLLLKFADREAHFTDKFLTSLKDADSLAPERCAHTLKGVAGNIAAKEVQQAADVLESSCRNAESEDKLVAYLEVVQAKINTVVNGIKKAELIVEHTPSDTQSHQLLPQLLTTLLAQAEGFDTEAVDTIGLIKHQYYKGNESFIDKIYVAIEAFDFEMVEQLTKQWLNQS